jgi:hypothetical protein
MAATATHLMEDVLPEGAPLRPWVLTVPFAWRKRLGYDGPLLSALTRLFVQTALDFYRARDAGDGEAPGWRWLALGDRVPPPHVVLCANAVIT